MSTLTAQNNVLQLKPPTTHKHKTLKIKHTAGEGFTTFGLDDQE